MSRVKLPILDGSDGMAKCARCGMALVVKTQYMQDEAAWRDVVDRIHQAMVVCWQCWEEIQEEDP